MRPFSIVYNLDILPPSSNNALRSSKFGYYPTKEYKEFKRYVMTLDKKQIEDNDWYVVKRTFYMPLRYKNKSIRKKDLTNMIKYLDDELCKLIGIDDSKIIAGSEVKVDDELEHCEWELMVCENEESYI